MRRLTACSIALLLAVVGSARPAAAQIAGGGELGADHVRATASDFGAGTFPGTGLPAAMPSVESPYSWERVDTAARCVVFAGPVPDELAGSVTVLPGLFGVPGPALQIGELQGGAPGALRLDGDAPLPPGARLVGEYVLDTATPRDGTPVAYVVPRCAPPGTPVPPTPPDAASIWRQTPLPRARVHASPPGTHEWPGIVNLESRFWGDPLPDARATVTLDGYVVDVAAHPVAYAWAFTDGTTSVGSSPGSAAAPLRATFRRRGDPAITLYVTWAGLAHVTAPGLGLDFGMQYLGTVTLPVSQPHHVAEIRALLRSR
jgi:hypothetical protein